MTLVELLAMPKGMNPIEYEKLLKDKQKLENQIRKASNAIFDEEESLDILADEVGSERYNKHLANKQKAEAKREKAQAKLEQIERKLNT
jgi:uncharacterized protein (DUF2164 family)